MKEIIAATLSFGLIGLFFSLLLAFLNHKLKVPEDPRVKEILELLPGLNCGACGFSSCKAYANAITEKPEQFSRCRANPAKKNEQIAKLLNLKPGSSSPKKQLVICRCGAEEKEKKTTSIYQGLPNCQAADITGGALDCTYGCLGFGDCARACPAGAINIKNKKVYIDSQKCTLCGKCIELCPRNLFLMIPYEKKGNFFVACRNKDKFKDVKDVCSRGCIACGLCAKAADSVYYLQENLSRIDYGRKAETAKLEAGKNKCPAKCIDSF